METPLWSPSREQIEATNMYAFMQSVAHRRNLVLNAYSDFYQWSVDHIADFWAEWWESGHRR